MKKQTITQKTKGIPIETLNKIIMTKEAIASCALDGETQCGDMTIEPKTITQTLAEIEKEIEQLEQNWSKHKDLHNEGGIIYFEKLKSKLQATKDTAKMMIDDEIEFLVKMLFKWSIEKKDATIVNPFKKRLQALRKREEEMK